MKLTRKRLEVEEHTIVAATLSLGGFGINS
jgi:hypothetical protein